MTDTDKIFSAKYVAQSISAWDIVKFADDRLTEGVYSDHYLAILDEETKVWSTVSPHLELAFIERGIKLPTYQQAIWIIVEHHVRIIVGGCLSPRKQFEKLLHDIGRFDLDKGITKYVGDNIGIETMYGWYHDDYSGIKEIEDGIYNECLYWLAVYGSDNN